MSEWRKNCLLPYIDVILLTVLTSHRLRPFQIAKLLYPNSAKAPSDLLKNPRRTFRKVMREDFLGLLDLSVGLSRRTERSRRPKKSSRMTFRKVMREDFLGLLDLSVGLSRRTES